tara:strand:- start:107 stop:661 length:555 start_codon:yes stop_codon:yes gene_type:complete
MGFNTPVTLTGAITVTAPLQNLPWSSTAPNGWTQIKNLPVNATVWFPGNDLNGNEQLFDYVTGNSGSNSNVWSDAAPAGWTQICVQTMDSSVTRWFIMNKSQWLNMINGVNLGGSSSGPGATGTVTPLASSTGTLFYGPSYTGTGTERPFISFTSDNYQAMYVEDSFGFHLNPFHAYGMGVFVR